MQTRFTDLVGCELPLQLAGMGGLSSAALAAAVSNAGGLGMFADPLAPPDVLGVELDEIAAATTKPFGLTVLMPFFNPACLPAAVERAAVIEFSFGPPAPDIVATVRDGGRLAGWQVGDAETARAAVDAGVDYLIAQGVEAGGHHVGDLAPRAAALREILDAVDVPVLAAGGIADAATFAAAIEAGADGCRVGTRFAVADEANIHPDYATAMIDATAPDTVITEWFDFFWPDTPHRILRQSLDGAIARTAEAEQAGEALAIPLQDPSLPDRSFDGDVFTRPLYAGTSVDAVERRQPAATIVEELTSLLD